MQGNEKKPFSDQLAMMKQRPNHGSHILHWSTPPPGLLKIANFVCWSKEGCAEIKSNANTGKFQYSIGPMHPNYTYEKQYQTSSQAEILKQSFPEHLGMMVGGREGAGKG